MSPETTKPESTPRNPFPKTAPGNAREHHQERKDATKEPGELEIDQTIEDSFPASDPPSRTPVTGP